MAAFDSTAPLRRFCFPGSPIELVSFRLRRLRRPLTVEKGYSCIPISVQF